MPISILFVIQWTTLTIQRHFGSVNMFMCVCVRACVRACVINVCYIQFLLFTGTAGISLLALLFLKIHRVYGYGVLHHA